VAPGPGGQRVQVKRVIERKPNPITAQQQEIIQNNLSIAKSADVRFYTLSLVAAYAGAMMRNDDKTIQGKGKELSDVVNQLAGDQSPPVATWARYLRLTWATPENGPDQVKEMIGSDYWPSRLLGSVAALGLGAGGKEMLQQLAQDTEPSIK